MPLYEDQIKSLATFIRSDLQQVESLRSFTAEITISGRVHDGEMKIQFSIGGDYNSGAVIGGTIEAVLTEYKRRQGWSKRNAPLELSFDGETKVDDTDIQF